MYTSIDKAAQQLGLDLSQQQLQQLCDYVVLLHKWNGAYNLSAIKDIPTMLVKHIYDCLAVVAPIHQQLMHSLPTAQHSVLDVGCGAGLPGIVLAICLPHAHITMLDAIQKKILFVRQTIGTLGLPNAQAHNGRIQDWDQQYPIITARAWTALSDIPLLAGHCLLPAGVIMAMKGPRIETEAQQLPTPWQIDRVLDLSVPQLNEPRTLAYIRKHTDSA